MNYIIAKIVKYMDDVNKLKEENILLKEKNILLKRKLERSEKHLKSALDYSNCELCNNCDKYKDFRSTNICIICRKIICYDCCISLLYCEDCYHPIN